MIDILYQQYALAQDIYNKLPVLNRGETWQDEHRELLENAYESGMIGKEKLNPGATYLGYGRGVVLASWDGDNFLYSKYELGFNDIERVPHVEDYRGWDLFVPVLELDTFLIKELIAEGSRRVDERFNLMETRL